MDLHFQHPSDVRPCDHLSAHDTKSDAFLLASWNVKCYSWKKCMDELFVDRVAETVGEFHLVALQEVRNPEVLWLLRRILRERTGADWKYECSAPLSRLIEEEGEEKKFEGEEDDGDSDPSNHRYTEYLAFVYRSDIVQLAQDELQTDPLNIARRPFTRTFQIDSIDLSITLVNVHLTSLRQSAQMEAAEIAYKLQKFAKNKVQGGAKLCVLGDFNIEPIGQGFPAGGPMTALIHHGTMVKTGDINDNIVLDKNKFKDDWTTFFIDSGVLLIDERYRDPGTTMSTRAHQKEVAQSLSDHHPVWAAFRVKNWADKAKNESAREDESTTEEKAPVPKSAPAQKKKRGKSSEKIAKNESARDIDVDANVGKGTKDDDKKGDKGKK